jgi:hypothetical protein
VQEVISSSNCNENKGENTLNLVVLRTTACSNLTSYAGKEREKVRKKKKNKKLICRFSILCALPSILLPSLPLLALPPLLALSPLL